MRIPQAPPPFNDLLRGTDDIGRLLALGPLVSGRYLHWDELRHRDPPSSGLSHERWWAGLKLSRVALYQELPLVDKHGRPFRFAMPDSVQRALYAIDRQAAGSLAMPSSLVSEDGRDRYLVSSLIEEAITSSQLEGASTTKEAAKQMLRSGRKPRDRSEQMILNNFRVMQNLRDLCKGPLTPETVLEIHREVTEYALDDPDAAGRYRQPGEDIKVMDAQHSTVLHEPPDAAGLPERLQRLCDFANRSDDSEPFVHPVVRAILLHLILGYDHPFVDGNGRTARALFYWSLARSGYWLMEYVSISRLLKNAPAQYARAYLHTETDDNDATYFLLHQLHVIDRSIQALYDYLARKRKETESAEARLGQASRLSDQLNHRQIALLGHALRHAGHGYTVASHQRSHRITPQTARTDLLGLAELGLLAKAKRGRAFVFYAPHNLNERIDQAAAD